MLTSTLCGGWCHQVRNGIRRINSSLETVKELPQGGTAVGTGINCYKGFAETFAVSLLLIFGRDLRIFFSCCDLG